ncbi:hypothetical protein CDD81_6717 [Ophiocordyceps australis]|uniref:Terpene synthase n=1 Tax=Ophiocordyceps australis TaxID=1399860 RepID=A0A2C5X9A8_9HYPO|nr:hypothetical protein CDD81_6717 [Ophiocordyceps australis]
MECRYSEEVCPSLYETHGLANGIPLRRHKNAVKEHRGALKAQSDWAQHVHPLNGYKGGLGDPFSFMQVTLPECCPERLEIISYANEYAFLYDDEMEKLNLKNESETMAWTLETFTEDMSNDGIDLKTRAENRLFINALRMMMAIDAERATTTIKAWSTYMRLAAGTRHSSFETLETYVPARIIDAGELLWFGLLTFGMALTIPDEEYNLCMELARPAYAALGLTNDLFSWTKEQKAAEQADHDYVFNAVWVIMKERLVSESQAKVICGEEIKKYISEFCGRVERARSKERLSKDVWVYLEALRYSYSGNLVWSIYCPRYQDG